MGSHIAPCRFPVQAGTRSGLLWSEYGFLLGVAIAAAVTVDPLAWGLATYPAIKHLALLITLPAIGLTLAGRRLFDPLPAARRPVRAAEAAWPLLVLAAIIVAGSLSARLLGDIRSTFLNVGLYMALTVAAAAMVLESDAPAALVRGYLRIVLVAATVMGCYLIANFGVRQVYHEQIFLVIPMAAWFFADTGIRPLKRWPAFAFFLSMAGFSQKYTSYLIGMITVAYLAAIVALPRLRSKPLLHRLALVYGFLLLGTAAAAGLAILVARGSLALPTGNVEYRLHTYGTALEQFKASPLWGSLFTAEAVEKFTLYAIGIADNMLPTHSDLLDLMAHGGLLGLGLAAWGLARVARIAYTSLLRPAALAHPWAPEAHTLALLSLAGGITFTFNPILLQPSMAYLLWTGVGLLLGLSLRAQSPAVLDCPKPRRLW
ncbi:hypothetical protein [Pelomicrobium sp.]|jgi:O-antigen ligase|uniref:hypothetical protein n=1 Tax=Pelomicrobium sp. TaxID=2815319 RepID=UPI002FDD3182